MPGGPFLLSVAAGGANCTYQWLCNAQPLAGENEPTLFRADGCGRIHGADHERVGFVISAPATVALDAEVSRLTNISWSNATVAGSFEKS